MLSTLMLLLAPGCGGTTTDDTASSPDTGTLGDTEDTETEDEPNDTDTACSGAVTRTHVGCTDDTWLLEVLGHEDADAAVVQLWDAESGALEASVALEEPCPGEWTAEAAVGALGLSCDALDGLRGAVAFTEAGAFDGDSALLNGELAPLDDAGVTWTRADGWAFEALSRVPLTRVEAQLLSSLDGSERVRVELVSDDGLDWSGAVETAAVGDVDPQAVHTLLRAWDGEALLVVYGL